MLYLIIVMPYIKYRQFSTAGNMTAGRPTGSGPATLSGGAPLLNTTIMLFLLQDGITNGAGAIAGALLARFVLDPLRVRWGYDTDTPSA